MARQVRQQHQRNNIAIVGDGQTERIYFADVRDTDRPKNLTLFPDFPRKIGSYVGVLEKAQELSREYSRVYALIDVDKIIQDSQQAAYNQMKIATQAMGVHVLENNPCFEIWLLMHFVHTGRLFSNCDGVTAELQRNGRIPGYNKTTKFLSKARLYHSLKEQLQENAMRNAQRLEVDRQNQDVLYPRAETYRFFEWYFQNVY